MSSDSSRALSDNSQSSDSLRKRVGKACDRCRLKKSKCDGTSPCSRCRVDNAICVFGERKKAHDKVYPKGYVEMLEQQQYQLVAGLQDTYKRLIALGAWPGPTLDEREGYPLTHDILSAIDILQPKADDHGDVFEEDPEKLQRRLLALGAPYMHRRASVSSDSDESVSHAHEHGRHKRKRSTKMDSPVVPSPSATSSLGTTSNDMDSLTIPTDPADQSQAPRNEAFSSKRKPSPLRTESPIIDSLPNLDDDAALMSAWSWQDMPETAMSTQEPQFTFPPQNPTYSNLLDTWPGLAPQGHFDPTFMAQYPAVLPSDSNNNAWMNGQLAQRDAMELDPTKFMAVAS